MCFDYSFFLLGSSRTGQYYFCFDVNLEIYCSILKGDISVINIHLIKMYLICMKSNSVNLFFSKGYLSQLHPKRDQNPLFVPETASISDLFIYESPRISNIRHLRPFCCPLHRVELVISVR